MAGKVKMADVRPDRDDKRSYSISLTKLSGKKIKDVEGYVSKEFGDPAFQVTTLVFEDGTTTRFGGEHDIAYLENWGEEVPNLDMDTLNDLYDEANS
jgi:hypothetical protein